MCIEEAYEVLDAINRNNKNDLKEELGDLLLQVIFQSQIIMLKKIILILMMLLTVFVIN